MYPSDLKARLAIRLPEDLRTFITTEAARNGSSQNSEVVRAVRERMDRENKDRPEAVTPERPNAKTTSPAKENDHGEDH